jgi:hypothetical protein
VPVWDDGRTEYPRRVSMGKKGRKRRARKKKNANHGNRPNA